MSIHIPYGKGHIEYTIPHDGLLTSRIDTLKSDRPGVEIVREAVLSPIGSKKLSELAVGKKTCTIIISDHTRPVPSRDILPPMLEELRKGSPDIDVTLLVATGFHRPTTTAELESKLGEEIAAREKIVVHDAFDAASNVEIGVLPSGAPLVIDRVAVETDLLISEGFIEPHFFAGFSGGRKSVLPGVCDKTTVLGNHCGAFIASPYARTGVLENNPLHIDMVAAARLANLQLVVNVIIDEEKKTVAAFAGENVDAFFTAEDRVVFNDPLVIVGMFHRGVSAVVEFQRFQTAVGTVDRQTVAFIRSGEVGRIVQQHAVFVLDVDHKGVINVDFRIKDTHIRTIFGIELFAAFEVVDMIVFSEDGGAAGFPAFLVSALSAFAAFIAETAFLFGGIENTVRTEVVQRTESMDGFGHTVDPPVDQVEVVAGLVDGQAAGVFAHTVPAVEVA